MKKETKTEGKEEQIAVISHYIHNKGYGFANNYEERAKTLIREIYDYNIDEEVTTHPSENTSYYTLFDDFFSVPFLPIENH